jgi:hypothetical protein
MEHIVPKTIAALRRPARRDGCTRKTLRCDFWNWGVDSVRPACCTAHLIEVVAFIDDLLTKHEIQHWLDYGTLLGAARDEQFIPWDDDGDIGVLAEDRDRILALAPEIAAAGYHVDTRSPAEPRINYSLVNGVGVDVSFWARVGDRLVPTFSETWAWPGQRGRTTFPAAYLEPGTQVRLYGHSFPAPAPLDAFLSENRYGPDYMTPRRGVPAGSRWLTPPTAEEMTPATVKLVASITDREPVVRELLYRSRLYRLPPWRKYWIEAGLPRVPAAWARARAEDGIEAAERTPVVEGLILSLALLEQTIAECEQHHWSLPLRRAGRRLARLSEGARERRG